MRGKWGLVICLIALTLTGCESSLINTSSEENQEAEKKAKEVAIQHIKDTYNREFKVTKVEHTQVLESRYVIRGTVEDGKDTPATVYWVLPDQVTDSYVLNYWNQELEPKIKEISKKHFDIKRIESISYTNGTLPNKYTGEIPSVYEVLKNGGDKDYLFKWTGEIYKNGGKYEQSIKNFLEEIEEMNFNRVRVTIYVYDDRLKTSTTKEDEGKYLLYEYVISIDDIQKAEIDSINLNQYKTVY
ncbi:MULTISPECIES: hypothetical protein [Thermoactinomyces]|uniref:hypothetical protein n=1 Tax=Thermoactinomyces TaxID=2023 RepID=UPI000504CCA3|nr:MULTISPECIES: hypothetical protein [Thermoactinomyces]KFZ39337.1 hypothetical protein JS81_14840 [Thermoactinomyces sp. Gus2-1]KYQ87320.1 hypothetical protein AYX07_01035 [Thermoactinomyces sp. AS95]MBA4835038.1 hypothetical protein [Thermoactinomyces intermedius]MBI0388239.1 hypothetical protein [Thermoactinomyces sp. CICC 24227]MCF6133766.1 hypothetical protein [Thermoactinomyces vulgaris]